MSCWHATVCPCHPTSHMRPCHATLGAFVFPIEYALSLATQV